MCEYEKRCYLKPTDPITRRTGLVDSESKCMTNELGCPEYQIKRRNARFRVSGLKGQLILDMYGI